MKKEIRKSIINICEEHSLFLQKGSNACKVIKNILKSNVTNLYMGAYPARYDETEDCVCQEAVLSISGVVFNFFRERT